MFTAILKQIIRKPRKYALAAVLLGFSAFLLGTGLTLSLLSAKTTEEMKTRFTTVGTAEQAPDGYDESFSPELQAELGIEGLPLYDRMVSPKELADMPGLKEPPIKQQVLFGGLFRENGEKIYAQESAQENKYKHVMYRFRIPSEERVAAEGEEILLRMTEGFKSGFFIEIIEVLHGLEYDGWAKELVGSLRLISAPGAEPPALEMGREYVGMFAFYNYLGSEFYMAEDVSRVASASLDEVTYEPVGNMGIVPAEDTAVIEEMLHFCGDFNADTFVITPVRSMAEFLAFGSKAVSIVDGRNITPEEFASGAKVCVVPETMVRDPDNSEYKNYISVGEKIEITFVAGTAGAAPENFDMGQGVTVQPVLFHRAPVTETYEIVGVYANKSYAENGATMAAEQILIPHTGAPDVPVIAARILTMGNNSFVIENGTAHQVVAWAEKHPNLLFQFEDGGYTLAAAGIGAVSRVGLVMLVSGIVAFLAVGAFFIRLEVSGGKRETGIRLALGEKKNRALCCLVVPLVFAVLVGTTGGVIAGQGVSGRLGQSTYEAAQQVSYSRKYSDKTMTGERAEFTPDFSGSPLWSLCIWAGANLLCAAGALFYGGRVLRVELHKLLGKEGAEE